MSWQLPWPRHLKMRRIWSLRLIMWRLLFQKLMADLSQNTISKVPLYQNSFRKIWEMISSPQLDSCRRASHLSRKVASNKVWQGSLSPKSPFSNSLTRYRPKFDHIIIPLQERLTILSLLRISNRTNLGLRWNLERTWQISKVPIVKLLWIWANRSRTRV